MICSKCGMMGMMFFWPHILGIEDGHDLQQERLDMAGAKLSPGK